MYLWLDIMDIRQNILEFPKFPDLLHNQNLAWYEANKCCVLYIEVIFYLKFFRRKSVLNSSCFSPQHLIFFVSNISSYICVIELLGLLKIGSIIYVKNIQIVNFFLPNSLLNGFINQQREITMNYWIQVCWMLELL